MISIALTTVDHSFWTDVGIFCRECVPVRTKLRARFLWLSSLIFRVRDRLKMIWINTGGRSAEMVDLKAQWNRPFVQFVRDAVGLLFEYNFSASFYEDLPVPRSGETSCPEPAARERLRGNQFHQSIDEGYSYIRHVTSLGSLCSGLREAGNFVAARFNFIAIGGEVA